MNEIVYVLINEAMPGYVKIGITNNDLENINRDQLPNNYIMWYAISKSERNLRIVS